MSAVMVAAPARSPTIGFVGDREQRNDTGEQMQEASGRRGGSGGREDAVSESDQTLQIPSVQPGDPVPQRVDPMDVNTVRI